MRFPSSSHHPRPWSWLRRVLFPLGFAAAAYCGPAERLACAQTEAPPAAAEEQEELLGQPFLQEAMMQKLNTEKMSDLDQVISLCQKSLESGLSESDQVFAKQLLSSTLYERAERLLQSLAEGRIDVRWARRRALALQSINQAIEVDPTQAESYLIKSRLHEFPGGDADEGKLAADKAIELFAGNPARRSVARLLRASFSKDVDERLQVVELAVQDDPKNLDAWRERGLLRLAKEQPDQAMTDFLHILEVDPEDLQSLEVVARILISQEKNEQAIERLSQFIAKQPEAVAPYILRAGVYSLSKQLDLAEKDLDRALELEPGQISALLARAQLFSDKNEFQEAMADASRALELSRGSPQLTARSLLLRSSIAMGDKDYKQAISDLRQLQRSDPENVPLKLQIAAVYMADGQPQTAVEIYGQILRDHPQDREAIRSRADALLAIGDHAQAIKDYEQTLAFSPDDTGVLNNLAWVLATSTFDELRDGNRAISLAKKACELTDYQAAHIVSTLAAGYAETGDFEQAIEWSTKAVELGEGEIKQQLSAELDRYKEHLPWRERQTMESHSQTLADDLMLDENEEKPKLPAETVKSPSPPPAAGSGDLRDGQQLQ